MHILFLSHYFPPEVNAPANRVSELARCWADAGHRVTIVTCAPNHPDGVVFAGHRNRLFAREEINGIEVIRLWTFIAANEGFLLRTLNYVSYFISVVFNSFRLPRPDAVVSTSPQFFCGLAGAAVSRIKDVPWLLEIRDLWPESIVAVGAMKAGWLIRLLESIEAWAYRKADAIVAVSPSFVQHITARGADPSRVTVVENGADLHLFDPDRDASTFRATHGLEGKFVVAYVGTHGMAHGLETLLQAAALTRDNFSIVYLMVGAGAERERLMALRERMGLDNVLMLPQQPREQMPLVWAATDASVILLRRSPLFTTVIPSKMFEAMAMARPIILAVDGQARRLMEAGACGLFVEPENAEALAHGVRKLAGDAGARIRLGRSGRNFVQANFSRTALARRYLNVISDAIRRAGARTRCQLTENPATLPIRIRRAVEFARHIPPRRIARRLWLMLKRRTLVALGPRSLPTPDAKPSATPPHPLLPPRSGMLRVDGHALRFTFLNRSLSFCDSPFLHRTHDRREQLWAMNLHYMDYLEEADDESFERLLREWLAHTKPYRPGYWLDAWNGYAVSLRVVVWMQQLATRPHLDARLREEMIESLKGQIEFLARNLETDLGGNHLVKNMKALLWASVFFDGPAAGSWRGIGLHLLREVLAEQILDDGMHEERSPSYHAQVFADLLEIRAAVDCGPLAPALDRCLYAMAQVAVDLAHPDGNAALFNDSGLHMAYAPAVLLDLWRTISGETITPRRTFALPNAGYYGARNGGDLIIADCGAISPDHLPAHGHGDVLSFELSVGGQRLVVDPGVYEYVAGNRRRKSRSAANHNTLCFEGSDQADFFGDFRVGRRPTARVLKYEERPDGFLLQGTHDGFSHLPGRPQHVRRFESEKGRLTIADWITGKSDDFSPPPAGEASSGEGSGVGGRTTCSTLDAPHPGALRCRGSGQSSSRLRGWRIKRANIEASALPPARIRFLIHPAWTIARLEHWRIRLETAGTAVDMAANVPLVIEDAAWWPDMGQEHATQAVVLTISAPMRVMTTFTWDLERT
jgi:glycosyltransferase involved in cell wall biosynthesis/uncharacterized heparinase superfamily protein